jgi:histidinol dehydrogenase
MSSPTFTIRALRDLTPAEAREKLARSGATIFNDETRAYARTVLDDVARGGDAAVAAYTARWDGVEIAEGAFHVTIDAFAAARAAVTPALAAAIDVAIGNARRYSEWLRPASPRTTTIAPGITVGVQYHPVRSAGLYVPSGKGTFPSTLVTMGTPAVVAGVERIAVVVPPRADGSIDPAVLVVADRLGIRDVFGCNGAAGVAAFAVGTATIPKVDVIAGPGNPVITAVQQAAATYGVRPLVTLGPTESMVVADESADPSLVAVDLLNEAEHGRDTATILLAVGRSVAERVVERLPAYLERLPEPRRAYAIEALARQGGVFVADDLGEAVAWVNRYGPEHVQLAVRNAASVATAITHAGEILIGQHTPFSAGNYTIGVPAALPTSGAAFGASGITVLSFLKTTSLAELTADGLAAVGPAAVRLGRHEGFPAHVLALTERGTSVGEESS